MTFWDETVLYGAVFNVMHTLWCTP